MTSDSDEQLRRRLVEVIGEVIRDERVHAGDDLTVRVVREDPAPTTASATRIFLRPLANPLSLGFLGLFFATVLLASTELGWVPTSDIHTLAAAILVLTVPAQLIACVYGFLCRDLVAGTGMGILSGTWGSLALSLLLSKPGSTSPAVAMILVTGAAALFVPAVAAAQAKLLAATVLLTTASRWGVTAAYEFSGSALVKTISGAVGLLLAAVAAYAALAFELEDQRRRTVLPTGRRGSGSLAMQGDLADEVARASNEAGVRRAL